MPLAQAVAQCNKRFKPVTLARGGSFGFRAHRFEIVKLETGEAPSLSFALGRRGRWSWEGVTKMLAQLAAR